MFLKKYLLWVVYIGTLIGLNETLIGSFHLPYRSVILSSITLTLLSLGRIKIPKAGTSLFIILIAVLFKINNIGYHSCTSNVFLCGPAALLLLGLSYEIFATILSSKTQVRYYQIIQICILTSIFAFSLFGLMNTIILKSWNSTMLLNYIFFRATLTAIASSCISILGFYLIRTFKIENLIKYNPYVVYGILGCLTIGLWLFGSLEKL